MSEDTIDVLLIEPSDGDARKTLATIRRKAPHVSTLRVIDGQQAARVMFEQGLFTREPQLPRLIIVDLGAAGDCAKVALKRLKNCGSAQDVSVVVFSGRRNERDILDSHLLGAHLNIMKSPDSETYASAVERILCTWRTGGFPLEYRDAC